MSEDNEIKASLTRKEIKLIKLLRIQEEYAYKIIEENINNVFEDWNKNRFSILSDKDEADSESADWLNTDFYKK